MSPFAVPGAAMPTHGRDKSRSVPTEVAIVSGILTVLVAILVPAVVVARDHPKGGSLPLRSSLELWLLDFIHSTWHGPLVLVASIVFGAIVAVVMYFVAVGLRRFWKA
jgi:hypothetical protein